MKNNQNPNYFNRSNYVTTVNNKSNQTNKILKIDNNNNKARNTIYNPNSNYGRLSNTDRINEKNKLSLKNYNSNNNNFYNYLLQTYSNENSFSFTKTEGGGGRGTNDENDTFQLNKTTRYDLRKMKYFQDGQTFFINKAKNTNNYKFLEIKKPKNKNSVLKLKNNNTISLEKKEEKEKPDNKKIESINKNINKNEKDNDEKINNHIFILIKSPTLKKNKDSKNKIRIDNYQYKEIKVKGPNNSKTIKKYKTGFGGKKNYEKYIPQTKIIKYPYDPQCKIIDDERMNNIGFKQIVSNIHKSVRKKV